MVVQHKPADLKHVVVSEVHKKGPLHKQVGDNRAFNNFVVASLRSQVTQWTGGLFFYLFLTFVFFRPLFVLLI